MPASLTYRQAPSRIPSEPEQSLLIHRVQEETGGCYMGWPLEGDQAPRGAEVVGFFSFSPGSLSTAKTFFKRRGSSESGLWDLSADPQVRTHSPGRSGHRLDDEGNCEGCPAHRLRCSWQVSQGVQGVASGSSIMGKVRLLLPGQHRLVFASLLGVSFCRMCLCMAACERTLLGHGPHSRVGASTWAGVWSRLEVAHCAGWLQTDAL